MNLFRIRYEANANIKIDNKQRMLKRYLKNNV